MTSSIITKHIVLVGDGTVGKTCLLHSFTNDAFLEEYIPTIYDKEVFDMTLDDVLHSIKLHDTAGQEDYERVRRLFYKDANCFMVCYSVDHRTSFDNILSKWIPELQPDGHCVPIVLVATKKDLRGGRGDFVTTEEGEELARQINANMFLECSAKENIMIKETVYEAVRASVAGVPEREEEEEECCCGFNPFSLF